MSLQSWIIVDLRSLGCMRDQSPRSKASRAFVTAKSTSSAPQLAMSASFSPVAGLTVSMRSPDFGAMNFPLM